MEKRIDLHIHTNYSDGVLSPKEVIDIAVKNNVSVVSITDHDSVHAYDNDLFNYAKSNNIKIIPGVEISTKWHNIGIHVLGYQIDIKNTKLNKILSLLRTARHDYLYNVADKLIKLGYILNTKELDKIDAVTKAHIACNVIENVKNSKILLSTFHHIPTMGEFIELIMNEGCPAYVEKVSITPIEAADLIREAGGIVVLAHPVAYQYEDNLNKDDILQLVREMNADGIEANYIYIDRNNNIINDIDNWKMFAKDNNLVITTGSDFHQNDEIHPDIGLIDYLN